MNNFSFINDAVNKQQSLNRYRQRVLIENNAGRLITVNGREYLNFSSNDYLGLNGHSAINKAFIRGVEQFGSSSSSSSLVTGYHQAHYDLEQQVCEWLNVEKCLLFTSGFAANSGVLSALANAKSHFILDKLSHASLIDGALQAKASAGCGFSRFNHNNVQHLNSKLLAPFDNKIVVTEGVFSMDGDCAPLTEIAKHTQEHSGLLLVDDAHGLGVFGSQGQGTTENLAPENKLVMGTFGKALASSGAFIGGSTRLIDYLVNFCRHYIYSTAMAPAQACATMASIEVCQNESWRREKIMALRALFKSKLADSIEITPSDSSILGIIVGDEKLTMRASEKLKEQGIWLTAIRPPTVKVGTSRLRVTINCSHNDRDIIDLANKLNEALG